MADQKHPRSIMVRPRVPPCLFDLPPHPFTVLQDAQQQEEPEIGYDNPLAIEKTKLAATVANGVMAKLIAMVKVRGSSTRAWPGFCLELVSHRPRPRWRGVKGPPRWILTARRWAHCPSTCARPATPPLWLKPPSTT